MLHFHSNNIKYTPEINSLIRKLNVKCVMNNEKKSPSDRKQILCHFILPLNLEHNWKAFALCVCIWRNMCNMFAPYDDC